MAQAECLIFIPVFFWHCCYVDLSSPVRSLVSHGFNFDLTGFSSIMQSSWYLFYSLWYVPARCVPVKCYSLSLLSLHRPLGTTVFLIWCFSPESQSQNGGMFMEHRERAKLVEQMQQSGTGDDWSALLPFHRTVDIVAVSVIADNSLSLILIFSRAHPSPQRLKFSKKFLSACFQII